MNALFGFSLDEELEKGIQLVNQGILNDPALAAARTLSRQQGEVVNLSETVEQLFSMEVLARLWC